MVKRIAALLLVLLLAAGSSLADLKLYESTPAQKALKTYIDNVNAFLVDNGELELNHIFDQVDTVVELGITLTDDAFMPEDVDVCVYLYYNSIDYLVLRVNSAQRFPQIASAFLRALSPKTMTQAESLKVPSERAKKAVSNPQDSFEDKVEEEKLNGTAPRTFYAYFPNQYRDGVNWMQLTIIFPLEGYWDGEEGVITSDTSTKAPPSDPDQDAGYEGYFSSDDYDHLNIYATPTPEPDSAAAEYDGWY